MRLLSEIIQAPDPINMESFFSKLPTTFNIVIFSIHGYFGQADVLGLPDTGGQVYIYSNLSPFASYCLLATLASLKSDFYFTGCLYSGSSKGFRGGNVTKNQAARAKREAQDSCGEFCKNMLRQVLRLIGEGIKMIKIFVSCFHDVNRYLVSYQMLEGQHAIRRWNLFLTHPILTS